MKKYLKLFLLFAVVTCMLLGATHIFAFETNQFSEPPLKVSVFSFANWSSLPEDNNYMHEWLLKNKNVDFTFNYVSSNQEDKMNMMLASKDVPDVCMILTGDSHLSIMNKWADAGLIIPMDQWLKKYPDFLKYTDATYNKAVYANKKDGKMYMIPGNPGSAPGNISLNVGSYIREDWLKKIGKPAPKTTDELYSVLKLFKQKIGKVGGKDIIPASFNGFRQYLAYTFTYDWYKIYPNNAKLDFYWQMPEITDYLVFMNRLYRDGLLDKEVITQNDDMYTAKLNSGRVGFSTGVNTWMDNANKALKAKDKNTRFIPNPVIRTPGGKAPRLSSTSPMQYVGVTVSAKFAENKENLQRLMDYLSWNATPEGAFTLRCGPIGVYEQIDANTGYWKDKPDVKAEKNKPNSTFEAKSGVQYYNLLAYPMAPLKVDPNYTDEMAMAQSVWKDGMQPANVYFDMSPWGATFNSKWGTLWGEWFKWEAKAIYAKSEAECRKIAKETIDYMNKNGGRTIANEKLKAYTDLKKTLGIK